MAVKFVQNLAVRQEVHDKLGRDIEHATAELETAIRNRTPVKTGNLKGHIDGRKVGWARGEVATNVEYAEYVEYGTTRFSPRAMFRQGASDVEKKGISIFKK